MPHPPLNIDWEAAKMLCREIGVREAARRMGVAQGTLQARSAREGWLRDMPRSQPLPASMQPKATNATKPSEVHANLLKEMASETRISHARGQLKAAQVVGEMNGREVLEEMPAILQSVKAAAILHGWGAGSTGQQSVRLDVLAQGGAAIRLELGAQAEPEGFDDEDDA